MLSGKAIKIGILGGGQLGAMLIRSAIDFGLEVSVMDKDLNAPGGRYTNSFLCADPMNYDDVVSFGKQCDIVTIEKEAVNASALKQLRDIGVRVFPSPELVEAIQDKYSQKELLLSYGLPIVPFIAIKNRKSIYDNKDKLPGCLKLRKNGYDGNGVMMIHSEEDVEYTFDAPCILEEKVAIKNEISVIVARGQNGEIACYDPVMMIFDKERHLIDFLLCPAYIANELKMRAYDLAIHFAEKSGLVGIIAMEMFITMDGRILVNEIAPRPHNSGHHTIEACATSQYEQHLRAILGLPLGDTRIKHHAATINILHCEGLDATEKILRMPDTYLHWYGKQNNKVGRKTGHITTLGNDIEEVIAKTATIRNLIR